jgi:hypothetical protein
MHVPPVPQIEHVRPDRYVMERERDQTDGLKPDADASADQDETPEEDQSPAERGYACIVGTRGGQRSTLR